MPLQLHETEVIKAPLISEKTTFLAAREERVHVRGGQVGDKDQIKAAIEKLYNVKVVGVRTVNVPGKPRRTRAGEKTTGEWKKAIVKLHPDQKIDLF